MQSTHWIRETASINWLEDPFNSLRGHQTTKTIILSDLQVFSFKMCVTANLPDSKYLGMTKFSFQSHTANAISNDSGKDRSFRIHEPFQSK